MRLTRPLRYAVTLALLPSSCVPEAQRSISAEQVAVDTVSSADAQKSLDTGSEASIDLIETPPETPGDLTVLPEDTQVPDLPPPQDSADVPAVLDANAGDISLSDGQDAEVRLCDDEGAPCDDGDECTVDDICKGGLCAGMPLASPMSWDKTYGGAEADWAVAITLTPDGKILVVGQENPEKKPADEDAWVIMLDPFGNTVWEQTFGGDGWDFARAVSVTPAGDILVAGQTNSFGAGDNDVWVFALDKDGVLLWQKLFGGPAPDGAFSIAALEDGGMAIAADTQSYGPTIGDEWWILRLDATGDLLWGKTFGDVSSDEPYALVATSDGGFAVAGHAMLPKGFGKADAWVMRLDGTGGLVWDTVLGTEDYDIARDLVECSNGDIFVLMEHSVLGADPYDARLVRLDAAGTVLLDEPIPGSGYSRRGHALTRTPSNLLVVAGWAKSMPDAQRDMWVSVLDPAGAVLWDTILGGDGIDTGESILALTDADYVTAGWTDSKGAGDMDAWVVRINTEGTSSCP